MEKYIKINQKNEIIDLFYDHQKIKFDGTEIQLKDEPKPTFKINGKSISNEHGVFIFTWDGSKVVEKKKAEIDADPKTIEALEEERKKPLMLDNKEILKLVDDTIQNISKSVVLPTQIVTESDNRVNIRNTVTTTKEVKNV
jgi:hypothetical protein